MTFSNTLIRKNLIKLALLLVVIVGFVGFFFSSSTSVSSFTSSFDQTLNKIANIGSITILAQNKPAVTPEPTASTTVGKPINPCDPGVGLGGCIGLINTKDYEKSAKPGENIIKFTLVIANLLTYIGGAIAVLIIVISSYGMFFAGGDKAKYEKALNNVGYAVVGLIISIVAYTIVAVISTFVASPNLVSVAKILLG